MALAAAAADTTAELIRSWSLRSSRLCLENDGTSAEGGVADLGVGVGDDPGTWRDAYLRNLRRLFEEEIVPHDVSLRVAGSDSVVRAHRCILEARNFPPLLGSRNRDADSIAIDQPVYAKDPDLLRAAVAACYGVVSDDKFRASAVSISADVGHIAQDLCELDPNNGADCEDLLEHSPADLRIVGRPAAANAREGEEGASAAEEWEIRGHRAVLCAHSEYFRSAMGWNDRSEEGEGTEADVAVIHLDSDQFPRDLVLKLVASCYGRPDPGDVRKPIQEMLDIIMGASYLTMQVVSLRYEDMLVNRLNRDNVAEMMTFAEENGARCLYFGCHKFLCSNSVLRDFHLSKSLEWDLSNLGWAKEGTSGGGATDAHKEKGTGGASSKQTLMSKKNKTWRQMLGLGKKSNDEGGNSRSGDRGDSKSQTQTTKEEMINRHVAFQLKFHQLRSVLQSDSLQIDEDGVLKIVLIWSSITESSKDDVEELISLVRLPFVPVNSKVMSKAVEVGLVGDGMLGICRLFQTDGDYRSAMLNSEAMFTPRMTVWMRNELRRKVHPPRPLRDDFPSFPMVRGPCRMFGVVNGRMNFEKISSVRRDDDDRFVCGFLDTSACVMSSPTDFPFGDIVTEHMPMNEESKVAMGRDSLAILTSEEAEALLAAMLRREDELRLHPRVQAAFGSIGEDEEEMSVFTTALQAHVSKEFNVNPKVGIELIRSATTLFPQTAQLAHYVRHNRAFEGPLKVGDVAPDVELLSLTGKRTTLWKELDGHRTTKVDGVTLEKPVVVLAASFT